MDERPKKTPNDDSGRHVFKDPFPAQCGALIKLFLTAYCTNSEMV